MPAQYVKTDKNDYIDAEAIAEAVTRPTVRFVPVGSGCGFASTFTFRNKDKA